MAAAIWITPASHRSCISLPTRQLRPLLDAVNTADPLRWFRALGLYTRTDEAGRVYPYSNQAADVLALLEATLRGTVWRCAPAAPCAP